MVEILGCVFFGEILIYVCLCEMSDEGIFIMVIDLNVLEFFVFVEIVVNVLVVLDEKGNCLVFKIRIFD